MRDDAHSKKSQRCSLRRHPPRNQINAAASKNTTATSLPFQSQQVDFRSWPQPSRTVVARFSRRSRTSDHRRWSPLDWTRKALVSVISQLDRGLVPMLASAYRWGYFARMGGRRRWCAMAWLTFGRIATPGIRAPQGRAGHIGTRHLHIPEHGSTASRHLFATSLTTSFSSAEARTIASIWVLFVCSVLRTNMSMRKLPTG